ncbi:unnamed protein product [Medioppia subpectinata]|uniref:HIG1 domain-containing protein n=1 Tax=Medioppia subpectinata TaxID=1979941 RepID=A0A7R9LSE1_9ACAR|nr:unnamed protein product [Medioppia subpectinata]CAG2121301.1 unnamed protein product [Medioppia subpectinata]
MAEDMAAKSETMDANVELEWIELREKMHNDNLKHDYNFMTKMVSKVKENPLVPIGMIGTTFCLTYGLICMRRGDSRKQQLMMRGRIAAQGFTIMALISGIMYSLVDRVRQS